jgi:hypothetical protein
MMTLFNVTWASSGNLPDRRRAMPAQKQMMSRMKLGMADSSEARLARAGSSSGESRQRAWLSTPYLKAVQLLAMLQEAIVPSAMSSRAEPI